MGHGRHTWIFATAILLIASSAPWADAVEPPKSFPVVPLPFWPFGKQDKSVALNQADTQSPRNAKSAIIKASASQAEQTTPGTPDPATDPVLLATKAVAAYESLNGCILRFTRRENLGKGIKPEETVLLKMRREPFAVHMKWLDTDAQGRQIIYNRAHDENAMQVITASGDIPLIGGNRRMKVDINSNMAKGSTRYSITDSGYGGAVLRYRKVVEDWQRGALPQGNIKSLGLVVRPEFSAKQAAVEMTFPPGYDPHFPRGAKRLICFSTESGLPTILTTWDENGLELEFYKFDRAFPVPLDDADFDPDRLWLPAVGKSSPK